MACDLVLSNLQPKVKKKKKNLQPFLFSFLSLPFGIFGNSCSEANSTSEKKSERPFYFRVVYGGVKNMS